MDNAWKQRLQAEASELGIVLDGGQVDALAAHIDLLLKWNAKINLTRITEAGEIRVKHVLDSLAALRVLPAGAETVLDLGTGPGFPGVPWLIARPELKVTLVDAVAKKVGFLKTALAQLRLQRGRAVHARLEGDPVGEGLAPAEVVVSRAFTNLADFLGLARAYLAPGGSVVAMLARRETEEDARQIADRAGFALAQVDRFSLPEAMGERILVRAVSRGT